MSVIKETVEKAVNMISPDTTTSGNVVKGHSSQSSITSTTSNLLKQTKEQNSFDHLEQNAQQERNRLSNMLDSYRNSSEITTNDDESFTDADDFISNRRSTDSTPDETVVAQPQSSNVNETEETVPNDQRFEFEVTTATPPRPKALQFSPDLSNLSQGNLPSSPSSAFNRRSIISDYTPSIHEVNKVAYVIEGQQSQSDNEDLPVLNNNNDENSKISRKASVIKISRNSSKGSNRNAADHEKNKESINSFSSNTNSGSGSSKYPESTYSGKGYQFEESTEPVQVKQTQEDKILEESESTSSFEYNIGPLKTTRGQQEPIIGERPQVTSIDPAIPSRSKRRPMSSTHIKAPVNKLKEETEQNRPKSVDIGGIDNLMVELNREIYKTPNQSSQESEVGPQVSTNDDNTRALHQRQESANSINSEKTKRPLPPPPPPKHEKKPSVTYEDELLLQDQDYVTEDEGEIKDNNETKSIKDAKKKHKKKSKTNKKRHSSGFKKGHFNHETLAQLLQVTEGTIIGQEFQNIGLEPTEKQLLERLVDSLSRLTADMVIDSDRHDESVRRLNKAIKALEGF